MAKYVRCAITSLISLKLLLILKNHGILQHVYRLSIESAVDALDELNDV